MTNKILVLSLIYIFGMIQIIYADRQTLNELINVNAPPEVKKQIGLLYSSNREEKYDACWALAKMKEDAQAAIPFLIDKLADYHFWDALNKRDISFQAAYALKEIGRPAVESLIGALKHKKSIVRSRAIYALEEIKDYRAFQPLIDTLSDRNRDVRKDASDALHKLAGYQMKHYTKKNGEFVCYYESEMNSDPKKWQKWWDENKNKF